MLLILDDINRTDASSLLGELINVLEYREHQVTDKTGDTITLPSKLYVIATMNPTINTGFQLDYAILRRFMVERIESNDAWLSDQRDTFGFDQFDEITEILRDSVHANYWPGHGFFTGSKSAVRRKLRYILLPLLRQYVSDGILDVGFESWIAAKEEELGSRYSIEDDWSPYSEGFRSSAHQRILCAL